MTCAEPELDDGAVVLLSPRELEELLDLPAGAAFLFALAAWVADELAAELPEVALAVDLDDACTGSVAATPAVVRTLASTAPNVTLRRRLRPRWR